jgi:hypothetical protein
MQLARRDKRRKGLERLLCAQRTKREQYVAIKVAGRGSVVIDVCRCHILLDGNPGEIFAPILPDAIYARQLQQLPEQQKEYFF